MSQHFDELFEQMTQLTVAVVGDVMLDTYWWGHVERISPEAPVPVVTLDKKEMRIGGAGNVALNTVALGAATFLFTVTGDDDEAKTLLDLLQKSRVDTAHIIKSKTRPTTNKTRIISRNQQMMRLDSEVTEDIEEANLLVQKFKDFINITKPDVVIFEDYNKGVLTEEVIHAMIDLCQAKKIVTTADPKRKNFFAYRNITLFKPNLKEVREGLNLLVDKVDETMLAEIHLQLRAHLQHAISLITLSERGIFYQEENEGKILPTHVRNIADVSGAGDTVIAVASLVYAATKNIGLAAAMANLAGGLVCEEVGTMAINKARLLAECKALL